MLNIVLGLASIKGAFLECYEAGFQAFRLALGSELLFHVIANLILLIKGLLYRQFKEAHPRGGLVSFLSKNPFVKDGLNGKDDEFATADFT